MKRFQFDNLIAILQTHTNGCLTASFRKTAAPVRPDITLIITKGLHKGQTLQVISARRSDVIGIVGDVKITVGYLNVEYLDDQGHAKIVDVTDMTGRMLAVDTWVCYSRATSYSHSLEIGRITKLTPSGGLKVTPYVVDGSKYAKASWGRTERTINDPNRTIKLPVETATMTYWLLRDFDMAALD